MREGNEGCGLVMTQDAGALGSASVVDASRDEEKDLETASTPAAAARPIFFVTPWRRMKSVAAVAAAGLSRRQAERTNSQTVELKRDTFLEKADDFNFGILRL